MPCNLTKSSYFGPCVVFLRECVKAVSSRFVSCELLPFIIAYAMTLHPWKRILHGWTARRKKCVSVDLMHLFLVRFVTIRLTYIYWLSSLWIYHYFEYIDCNIWFIALVNLHPFNAHIWKSSSPNTCLLPNTYIYDNGIYTHMFTINDTYVAEFHQKMKTYTSSFADKWGWEVNLSLNW